MTILVKTVMASFWVMSMFLLMIGINAVLVEPVLSPLWTSTKLFVIVLIEDFKKRYMCLDVLSFCY